MKMITMLEPRMVRIEQIRATLDDQRFASEAVSIALDVQELWAADPAAMPEDPNEWRDWMRTNVPQFATCRNVKLTLAVLASLVEKPSRPERRGPSIRQ
jgi:hypothetical protein